MSGNLRHRPSVAAPTSRHEEPRLRVLAGAELDDAVIDDAAAFFRFTFANAFGELYVRQSTGELLSASTAADAYLPLDVIDTCPSGLRLRDEVLPKVFDPETTRAMLARKLRAHDSALVLLESGNEVEGLTFAYRARLDAVFANEWAYPWAYVAPSHRLPELVRPLGRLLDALERAGFRSMAPETPVLCWNCVATAPEARSLANFLALAGALFRRMRNAADLLVIGETVVGSTAHELFRAVGAAEIEDVLDPPLVLVCTRVANAAAKYTLPMREFIPLLRAARAARH